VIVLKGSRKKDARVGPCVCHARVNRLDSGKGHVISNISNCSCCHALIGAAITHRRIRRLGMKVFPSEGRKKAKGEGRKKRVREESSNETLVLAPNVATLYLLRY